MAHAENQITIDRSPEAVYAFLADGLNNPKWRSGVQAISLRSGAAGSVGAIYQQTLTGPGGRPVAGDYEITEARPGEYLAFHVVAGPARPVGEYRLTQDARGTLVRFTLDVQPKGLMKLAGPLIQRTMGAEVSQLTSLKACLESS
ncbi:SRPBCC family protein [Arthrobacter sp. MMS24-T111]